jgi:hypothetical protein
MSRNLALGALGCALALGASAATCAAAGRDWKAFPAIVQVDTAADVFAIGDAHGDWQQLAKVLAGAKLISAPPSAPDQVTWSGGGSVLVITGDMIDKGPDSLGVIALVRALRSDAAAHGGRVIVTMGNHEAEFLAKPGGHKTQEFSDELTKANLDPKKVGKCHGDIGEFLCTLAIGVRVNDWFFSHGGNTNGRTIDELEKAIDTSAKDSFDSPELGGKNSDNSIVEARLNEQGPCGLPWIQDGCSKKHPDKLLLPGYIKTLGVNHLVQGHQPGKVVFPDGLKRQKGHFYQRYGLLFLIDAGMSIGINDSGGGALRITGSGSDAQAIVICPDGKDTAVLWNKDMTDHADKFCPRDGASVN